MSSVSAESLSVMMSVCETCKKRAMRDVVLVTSGKAATSSTCWRRNAGRREADDVSCMYGVIYSRYKVDAERLSESLPKTTTERT